MWHFSADPANRPSAVGGRDLATCSSSATSARTTRALVFGGLPGYLWASIADEVADYLQRNAAGAEGFLAGGLWMAWLEQSKKQGLPALEALRRWIGAPEDPERGGIAAGA